ncbi:MAG: hypothetical protein M3441_20360 [Chloroflexota bacterium]|nr:hypothetical protein [Chloroflexota bacterium]
MYLVYAYRSGEDSELRASTRIGGATREIQGLADVETEFNLFGPGKQWDQPAGVGMPQAGEGASILDNTLVIGLLVLGLGLALTNVVNGRARRLPS